MWGRKKEKKNILIVGGFNKARFLATSLQNEGYHVTVVNKNYEDCEELAEVNGLNVIYGDGSKKYILEEAAADSCQVAIAMTGKDEINLVVCEMCKRYFNVKKTMAVLNDPAKTDFFYQMGVDRVVCALNMITGLMQEQAVMDEITEIIPVDEEQVHISEMPIPRRSPLSGKKLWELNLPKELIIGCILRDNQSIIPRGETVLKEGDMLVIITSDRSKLNAIKEWPNYAVS